MRKLICGLFCTFLIFMGLATVVKGQNTELINPQKKALVLEMVDIVGTKKYLQVMSDYVKENLKQTYPQYADMLIEELSNYLRYDSMVAQLLPIYAKHYSEQDLQGIIAFYKSPVGKKMLAEMPAILQESMEVNKERSKLLQEKITQRIQELEDKKKIQSEGATDPSDPADPPSVVEEAENAAPTWK